MKVTFKTKEITEDLVKKFANEQLLHQDFHLDINDTYLVFGLFIKNNGAVIIDCLNKYNHVHSYPLDLFEIEDGKVSKYWIMKVNKNGEIQFSVKEFYDNIYFLDDLSEDIPEVVSQFQDLLKRMQNEI